MKHVLNLDLDYDLPEPKKGDPPRLINPEITRNIIDNAYPYNYPKVPSKVAIQWRSVVKQMDEVIKAKKVFVIFSENDFQSVYKEVYGCDYPSEQAFLVPVVLSELDKVKHRSEKEAQEILANTEEADKDIEQVNKVLEMSKVKK